MMKWVNGAEEVMRRKVWRVRWRSKVITLKDQWEWVNPLRLNQRVMRLPHSDPEDSTALNSVEAAKLKSRQLPKPQLQTKDQEHGNKQWTT